MRKLLRRRQFGDPLLRGQARRLAAAEMKSTATRLLIADMRHTLKTKKYGIGLAAPQVGHDLALAIIEIQPTKLRPKLAKSKRFSLVIINPAIIKHHGRRKQLYEGCISFAQVFAKVPRYKKIRLRYFDQKAKRHERDFKGIIAHVIQHEVDHLNGQLFVDKVKDPKSYITITEYKKRIVDAEEIA